MSTIRPGRAIFVCLAITLFASTFAYAGATPHMISFGGVSLVRGQGARINVVISNPDLMPAGATMNVTLTFNIYEVVPDTPDRSATMLRFVSRQSTQVTLGAQDGATLDLVVPDKGAFFVSGVVIDNPDARTTTNVNATFEVREAKKTLFLNPPVASDLATTSGQ